MALTLLKPKIPTPHVEIGEKPSQPVSRHDCTGCRQLAEQFYRRRRLDSTLAVPYLTVILKSCPCSCIIYCWRSMGMTPRQINWLRRFIESTRLLSRLERGKALEIANALDLDLPASDGMQEILFPTPKSLARADQGEGQGQGCSETIATISLTDENGKTIQLAMLENGEIVLTEPKDKNAKTGVQSNNHPVPA
jgi:hypothetical protein